MSVSTLSSLIPKNNPVQCIIIGFVEVDQSKYMSPLIAQVSSNFMRIIQKFEKDWHPKKDIRLKLVNTHAICSESIGKFQS